MPTGIYCLLSETLAWLSKFISVNNNGNLKQYQTAEPELVDPLTDNQRNYTNCLCILIIHKGKLYATYEFKILPVY